MNNILLKELVSSYGIRLPAIFAGVCGVLPLLIFVQSFINADIAVLIGFIFMWLIIILSYPGTLITGLFYSSGAIESWWQIIIGAMIAVTFYAILGALIENRDGARHSSMYWVVYSALLILCFLVTFAGMISLAVLSDFKTTIG